MVSCRTCGTVLQADCTPECLEKRDVRVEKLKEEVKELIKERDMFRGLFPKRWLKKGYV